MTNHRNARKTSCPFGHVLTEPNLTPAGLRRNRRDCLSCSRARAYLVGRKRLGHRPEHPLVVYADGYYRALGLEVPTAGAHEGRVR